MRAQILRCLTSGLFLIILVTVCKSRPNCAACVTAILIRTRPLPFHDTQGQHARNEHYAHSRRPVRRRLLLPRSY
jgi:hypothetical protein